MLFKEWISKVNPQDIAKLASNFDKSAKLLLSLIKITSINEASSYVRNAGDKLVSSSKFSAWMKEKFNAELRTGSWGLPVKSCGNDGCAYFYTNKIVVKITGDGREMKIASVIKGHLELVPIIDVIEFDVGEEFYGAIIMRELKEESYVFNRAIHEASGIVSAICYNLQSIVEKHPDVPIEWIRRRLSVAYMIRSEQGEVSRETKMAIRDLVKVLQLVYDKSGYLVGADWGGRNLGVTDKGKFQPYDFGRSDMHEPKYHSVEIPPPEHFGQFGNHST